MNDDGWVDGRDDEEVKKKEISRDYVSYRSPYYHMYAFMPERSKGVHSSCIVFVLVGSNPTECIHFLFYFYIIIIPPTSLSLSSLVVISGCTSMFCWEQTTVLSTGNHGSQFSH